MTRGDPDRAMIQIQLWWLREIQIEWWSRLRYDPDPNPYRVMIQIQSSDDDPDRVMIQVQSSDDDPDPVMIQIQWWCSMTIQIEKWSRSSDVDDLKKKMTWRQRWSSWYREEDQCWKSCQKNTFLVKRECWCICNFEMYSSMYLMYCNPMFFWDVSIMYLSHVIMPQCSDRED